MTYTYITWSNSDASRHPQRPSNFHHSPNPDHNGHVNYSAALPPNDPHCVRWREHVAAYVAKHCNLPGGTTYSFRGFPEGYTLYCNYKTESNDDDEPRMDYYLYGSKTVTKFRSPNEFVPHALWLLGGMEPGNCKCQYCRKNYTQTEVNKELGLPKKRSRLAKRYDDFVD